MLKSRGFFPSLWFALAVVLLLVGTLGCGSGNPYPPGSFQRGVFFAENGKNLEAVSAFESYVRRNPTDSLAAEAQFKKAMTYLTMKEYPLAVVEFQILRKDYPTSPLVEEALYREGVSYLHQVGRVERDISGAYQARLHFQDFLATYPGSKFRPDVEKAMTEISNLIVSKRLKEISVYKARHRYKAIVTTMAMIQETEPKSSLLDKVMWEQAQASFALGEDDAGYSTLRELTQRFPESPWSVKARRKLESPEGAASADSLKS